MVEQFAQRYADRVRVVGLGTQDSYALAEEFVARNGTTTPLMTWDETFLTWDHYEVIGQPVAILLDPDGNQLGRWNGLTNEMVELVEAS